MFQHKVHKFSCIWFIGIVCLALSLFIASAPDRAYADELEGSSKIVIPSTAKDVGNILHDTRIVLTPAGQNYAVSMNDDGAFIGNRLHLFWLGTSPKISVEWDSKNNNGYTLTSYNDYKETSKSSFVWDVDDRSASPGAVLHVWKRYDDNHFQDFKFYQETDGTYYIVNVGGGYFVGLENSGSDENNNKLVLTDKPVKWDVEILTRDSSVPIARSSYADAHNWMSLLPDDKYLTELSIPGTHDSGTANIQFAIDPQTSFSQTQQYYINEQLNVGVRAFDLRLGTGIFTVSDPNIVHGSMLVPCYDNKGNPLHLSKVMGWFEAFLRDHPQETVILIVKNDDADDAIITKAMEGYITENPDLFWDKETVPKLGEVRGKIVLMRRYELKGATLGSVRFGLDLTDWDKLVSEHGTAKTPALIYGDADYKTLTSVWVQDYYDTNADEKIKYVETTLDWSDLMSSQSYLFNFTSCTDSNPFSAARNLNLNLISNRHFDEDYKENIGIIMMDFIDGNWSRRIYERNFKTTVPAITFPDGASLTYGETLNEAQLGVMIEGKLTGVGEASVDGHFEFVDGDTVRPQVQDSESTKYRLQFVQDLGNGETITYQGPEITVKVEPRRITVRANTAVMVYGAVPGDLLYANPENMEYTLMEGPLAPGDDFDDVGIRFFAVDKQGKAIDDSADAGEYDIDRDLSNVSPNYKVTILLESYDSKFIIDQRLLSVTWSSFGDIVVGDSAEDSVIPTINNLAEKDIDPEAGALCTIDEVKYFKGSDFQTEFLEATYSEAGKYGAKVISVKGKKAGNYLIDSRSAVSLVYDVREKKEDVVFPEVATLTYGQSIDEAVFIGGSGGGTFVLKAKEGSAETPNADTYTTGYFVEHQIEGSYPIPSKDIELVVNKKPITVRASLAHTAYGETLPTYKFSFDESELAVIGGKTDTADDLMIELVAIDEGGNNIDNNNIPAVSSLYNRTAVGAYRITGFADDASNYEVTIIDSLHIITKRVVEFTWSGYEGDSGEALVYNGDPVEVVATIDNLVPLDEEGIRSSGLDDCTLVIDGGTGANAGSYSAVITDLAGDDKDNYRLPEGVALFKDYSIEQATPEVNFPDSASLVYGQTLKEATISGTPSSDVAGAFSINYPEEVLDAGSHTRAIFFTPEDMANYKRVYGTMDVTVSQAAPTTPGPFEVTLGVGESRTLSSVSLPEGWSWDDPSTVLAEGAHTYKASYHDTQGNYYDAQSVEIAVQTVISKDGGTDDGEGGGKGDKDSLAGTADRLDLRVLGATASISLLVLLSITLLRRLSRKAQG